MHCNIVSFYIVLYILAKLHMGSYQPIHLYRLIHFAGSIKIIIIIIIILSE